MTTHRKAHTKSRKGCFQCKTRHQKCSETRPRCANCTRLETECTWPTQPTPQQGHNYESVVFGSPSTSSRPSSNYQLGFPHPASSHSSPRSSPQALFPSQSSTQPASSPPPDLAIDDLSLLHHWTLNTALTLTEVDTQTFLWQSNIVELGFKHPYLLHAILAVAALHKAVVYPAERSQFLVKSTSHLNATLRSFPALLDSPDPTTCAPIFATSCLVSMHKMAEAQVVEIDDIILNFCDWSRLLYGVKAVIQPNWQRLRTTELAPIMANTKRRGQYKGEVWEVLRLRSLVEHHLTGDEGSELKKACLEAVEELHITYLEVQDSIAERSVKGLVQSWSAIIPELYVDLLSRKHPVAMIILAYYAVLVRAQRSWWTRHWDTSIIAAVEASLPPEYQQWLCWPKTYFIQ